ncbi:MAG: Asp-tRNA(Asn)/Glu-tRNA(Gln) amidotransferase subunit GatB [Candidatus Latescibacterota bacterium]|nr:Asp-tRNA(Asn)/Glu-tRNA(Gln) amidotransferase subunit GatB [Candidatus Latescibacterota bacterium]
MNYETVIGMEVHVELETAAKMFCRCRAHHFQIPPNSHICPVCTSQPGSLPVINGRAIELTVMTGMALNCQIRRHSVFDRKNYVYPDLPKGYQISQYGAPLCEEGWVEMSVDGGETGRSLRRVGIVRVHLEEDTGKLVHSGNSSLVDYNRAGVPLMEIVSDSSLRSSEEACEYVQKIRQLVRYLGASSGDMEKGAMRCEANISVRPTGSADFGTKVEVKNLNSFRSVRNAIDYEVKRQIETLEEGGSVRQVTMGWDENDGFTREQRSKEYDDDYRYFPEPDLKAVDLSDDWIEAVRSRLPELADARATRFQSEFGLTAEEAALLTEDQALAAYYEEAASKPGADPKQVSNWIVGQLFRRLKEEEITIEEVQIRPDELVELIGLVKDGTINQTAAREVFDRMWEKDAASPTRIVEELGLKQLSDSGELEQAVAAVIAENPDAVKKIKTGNEKPIQFLMGQVMRATRGKANPQLVQELVRRQISG